MNQLIAAPVSTPGCVPTASARSAIPVVWAWAALFVNVLAFLGPTIVPIPGCHRPAGHPGLAPDWRSSWRSWRTGTA